MYYVTRNYSQSEKEKIKSNPDFDTLPDLFKWMQNELMIVSPPRCGTATVLHGIQEHIKKTRGDKSTIKRYGYGKPLSWYRENKPKLYETLYTQLTCNKLLIVRNPYKRVVSSLYALGMDSYAKNRKEFLASPYGVPQNEFIYFHDNKRMDTANYRLEDIVDTIMSVSKYDWDMFEMRNVTPNKDKVKLTDKEYNMISEDFAEDFDLLGYNTV